MKIIYKGKETETTKTLRGGVLTDINGNILIDKNTFIEKCCNAIDNKVKHGVRRFSFSFEEKGIVFNYELTPAETKKNALNLFSYNTNRNKILTITFRPTKAEKTFLKSNFTPFSTLNKQDVLLVGTKNNGINTEILLSGKFHKQTFSDGKINGKRAELKASTLNNSGSLSKTSDIYIFYELQY